MKRIVTLFTVFFCLTTNFLLAGSIDYLTNQSAKVAVTFHRVASTDASADIANYNPAGTAFLPKGLYLDLSSQMLFKIYNAEATGTNSGKNKYGQEEPTWYLPNFYALYNFGRLGPGRLATWIQAGIPAGGGTVKWKDGTVGTYGAYANSFSGYSAVDEQVEDHSFEAYSVYYGIGIGAAYSFYNDMFSVSAGVRFVIPDRYARLTARSTPILGGVGDVRISLDAKFSWQSFGVTPVVGFAARPIKGLSLGLRYEVETFLTFKYKQEHLRTSPETIALVVNVYDSVQQSLAEGGLRDGNKFNYNLPHIISFGAEYDMSFLLKGLSLMTSFTLYLLPVADLGKYFDSSDGTEDPLGDVNEYFGVGWETGLAATWQALPALKVGAGFMYNTPGTKKKYFTDSKTMLNCSANPPLDSVTVGAGGTWLFESIGLDLTIAFAVTSYIPFKGGLSTAYEDYTVSYKKNVYTVVTGVSYQIQFGAPEKETMLRKRKRRIQ